MFDRWLSRLHIPSFAWGVGITIASLCAIQVIIVVIEGAK